MLRRKGSFMRNTKIFTAFGAAGALLGLSLLGAPAASAASDSNAGSVTRGVAAKVTGVAACKQIMNPADYPKGTTLVDLSGIADFTPVSSQDGVTFTPTLEKRSVPGSWGTWGSPPDTET